MNLQRTLCAALLAAGALSGSAQASLVNLGDGTVLDTATNLVWLKDWNLNGLADPDTQAAWANNLVFAGASNWLLPSQAQFQAVRNDAGSYADFNAVFDHVGAGQSAGGGLYWSSSVRAPDQCQGDNLVAGAMPAPQAAYGQLVVQIADPRFGLCYADLRDAIAWGAVAVRTGGVLATVPEPQTLALGLVGLALAGLTRRRRGAPGR